MRYRGLIVALVASLVAMATVLVQSDLAFVVSGLAIAAAFVGGVRHFLDHREHLK